MFTWIKNFFNKAVASFKEFFDKAFPIAKQAFLGRISNIALKIVSELDMTTLSNEERRKEAFKRIEEYAKQQGLAYKDHLIELAILMAVSALRPAPTEPGA